MSLSWMPPKITEALEELNLEVQVPVVPEISTLLSQTVLFQGKKLRPILCFLMGKLMGIPLEELQPYARAAEFVHAATLAHDDVIDDSPLRRDQLSLNRRSTNTKAVLIGDLLLARVMEELARLGNVMIIHDLAKTVQDLVTGEWLQWEARGVTTVTRAHLELVARHKTSSLMRWCCMTPVYLLNSDLKLDRQFLLDCARSFGEALGLAFQMVDDIIDYSQEGGKPMAQDLSQGLVNFVTLEILESQPHYRMTLEKKLNHSALEWPWSEDELKDACERVRMSAQAQLDKAQTCLNELINYLLSQDVLLDHEAKQAFHAILFGLRNRVR